MNWLRRIIPWAFQHDMHVQTGGVLWNPKTKVCEIRLVCRRCGFQGDYYELSDFKAFARQLYRRGCRGSWGHRPDPEAEKWWAYIKGLGK